MKLDLPVLMKTTFTIRFPLLALCAGLLVAGLSGCQTISAQRTLPPSIRTVAVPVFVNRSAEPGIEETATVFTQEEFLADGRLNLVRPDDADAIVNVVINDYRLRGINFDTDDFARDQAIEVRATVTINRNAPGRPEIGGPRIVTASAYYRSDKRRIGFEPEPVGRERALRDLARSIVREVITGETPAEG